MAKKQPVIWALLSIFRKITCALPHSAAVAFGGYLGALVPYFTPKKLKEASLRCSKVLGIPYKEAMSIVKHAYSNFGRSTAEFARMPVMAHRLDELIDACGEDNLRRAVDAGKGVIVATAHIGNWEYAAAWCAQHGYQMNALGADQRDERITNLVMDLRRTGGTKALGKASDLKSMIKALQAGEIIAVPIDQDAKKAGVLSPFLGYPASTPVGIAKLAGRLGCAVLLAFCVRQSDGVKLELNFLPVLKGRDGEPYGKNIQTSIDDCNDIISDWIKKYPDQWMWMYPRWESVERGEFGELRN